MIQTRAFLQNVQIEETQIKNQTVQPFSVTNLQLEDLANIYNEEIERNEENEKKFQEYLDKQDENEDPREGLLKQFTEEERQYKIVDLSNNCVYDSRNDEDISKLTSNGSPKSPTMIKKKTDMERILEKRGKDQQ